MYEEQKPDAYTMGKTICQNLDAFLLRAESSVAFFLLVNILFFCFCCLSIMSGFILEQVDACQFSRLPVDL